MKLRKRIVATIAAMAALVTSFCIARGVIAEQAAEVTTRAWVMCKPGDWVNVRRVPSKSGQEVGYLESGDAFLTDGTSSDGWIRCCGIGEFGEGWVYCGYVVTEEPRVVMSNYICASNGRVACRRWMGGPKVANRPWIANGSTVTVFCIADGWACTSRGYVKAEYLEADPE